jgi:hypothetical protein
LARPYLEKTLHKKGLVKWVQMQTLNSSPNTTKKKKKKYRGQEVLEVRNLLASTSFSVV